MNHWGIFFCGGRGASENYTGRMDFESLFGLLARVLAIAMKIQFPTRVSLFSVKRTVMWKHYQGLSKFHENNENQTKRLVRNAKAASRDNKKAQYEMGSWASVIAMNEILKKRMIREPSRVHFETHSPEFWRCLNLVSRIVYAMFLFA